MAANVTVLQGKLGADPELRYTQGGTPVCKFSIANSTVFTKNGEKTEQVLWMNVVAWGSLGEIVAKFLSKGSECVVTGKLQQSKFTNKAGAEIKVIELKASEVSFTGTSKSNKQASQPTDEEDFPF